MKKIIIIITLLFLTGCNKYNDINNLLVVDTLKIDYQESYILTFNIKNDNQEIITTGNTLNDAFNNIYKEINKKIYINNMNLLILTCNSLSKLDEINNYFKINSDTRSDFNIAIINKDIKDSYNYLINLEIETGTIKNIKYNEFIKLDNPYLPIIDKENYLLFINKELYLDENNTILYNILTNNIKTFIYKDYKIININTTKNKDNYNIYLYTNNNINELINILKKDLNNFKDKYKDIISINNINIKGENINDKNK